MTSFLWKRKAGRNVSKTISEAFEANSKPDKDELDEADIDWISLAPKRRMIQLEDATVKSNRLKQEGITLAEAERYWEAIRKWDEALQLTPLNETLYEMKAQALLILNEVYPSIAAAQRCVELNGSWWVGYQTLGRAHLALGEVRLALRSFSVALHLNPDDEELRRNDFNWAHDLLQKKILAEKLLKEANDEAPKIVEITTDDEEAAPVASGDSGCDQVVVRKPQTSDSDLGEKSSNGCLVKSLKRIPANYVVMRD